MNFTQFFSTDDIRITFGDDEEGFVYIIQSGGKCKIGTSKEPRKRIKQIELLIGSPIMTALVSEPCANYKEAEKDAHREFAPYRAMGEWFLVSPQEIGKYFDSVKAEKTPQEVIDERMKRLAQLINL